MSISTQPLVDRVSVNCANSLKGKLKRSLSLSLSESPKAKAIRKQLTQESAPKSNTSLRVVRKHEKARLPIRGSSGAAGYDLCSVEKVTIPPRSRALVDTGLSIQVPHGTYGRVAPRSGLAVKHFIDTGAGVIDEDYRGVVKVVLFNFGEESFTVNPGDRVAQLILEKILTPEVHEVSNLDDTDRGAGGFGSTGGFGAQQ